MEGFKNPIHGNRPLEGYPPLPPRPPRMRFSQKVSGKEERRKPLDSIAVSLTPRSQGDGNAIYKNALRPFTTLVDIYFNILIIILGQSR